MFYSNCLIEAIKSKMRHPFKVKIRYVPANLNEVFCPHIMWQDGEYTYDFYAEGYLKPLQRIWHKGYVRKSEFGYYDKVISTLIEWSNRK